MNNKKIFITISTAFIIAVLVTSNLASAADLNQAVSTLPQNEEWSIMAFASVGQNVGASLLATPLNSSVATDYEKRILAITAQGQDPASVSSENFVAKLEAMFDGTQIGDATLLNDDIFGILALASANGSANIISKSKQFILSHQNSDGGWGYSTNVSSDSNTTAMAVAALSIGGSAPQSALNYLGSCQNSSGGYGYTPGQPADGASTAWVISGLIAANQTVPISAKTFLESLQTAGGSFKWMPGDSVGSSLVTAYAVIALSGHTLPIKTFTPYQTPASSSMVHITITYPGNKIFVGDLSFTNQTALSALTTAAAQINLLYQIKQTSLGQFVQSIDGYVNSGTSGWQYAVNGTVPATGAENYVLHSGDTLQWFYGAANSNPF